MQEFLLNEILLEMDRHIIRVFLDGLLEKSKPSKEALKEYGDQLDEQWNKGVEYKDPSQLTQQYYMKQRRKITIVLLDFY